jgi:drug/metabolite transporter (DMT)-like permease
VTTTDNFVRAAPLVLVPALLFRGAIDLTPRGALLALASGALASGVGYVVWYAALRGLSAARAATVQLTAPAVAGIGGVIFLNENLSLRLLLSALLILGGVGLTLMGRESRSAPSPRR